MRTLWKLVDAAVAADFKDDRGECIFRHVQSGFARDENRRPAGAMVNKKLDFFCSVRIPDRGTERLKNAQGKNCQWTAGESAVPGPRPQSGPTPLHHQTAAPQSDAEFEMGEWRNGRIA